MTPSAGEPCAPPGWRQSQSPQPQRSPCSPLVRGDSPQQTSARTKSQTRKPRSHHPFTRHRRCMSSHTGDGRGEMEFEVQANGACKVTELLLCPLWAASFACIPGRQSDCVSPSSPSAGFYTHVDWHGPPALCEYIPDGAGGAPDTGVRCTTGFSQVRRRTRVGVLCCALTHSIARTPHPIHRRAVPLSRHLEAVHHALRKSLHAPPRRKAAAAASKHKPLTLTPCHFKTRYHQHHHYPSPPSLPRKRNTNLTRLALYHPNLQSILQSDAVFDVLNAACFAEMSTEQCARFCNGHGTCSTAHPGTCACDAQWYSVHTPHSHYSLQRRVRVPCLVLWALLTQRHLLTHTTNDAHLQEWPAVRSIDSP